MYSIGSFLQEEELSGLKLVVGGSNLQAEITNINIIDNPDSYDWLSSGDLLLTTGYFCRDDEAVQRQLIRELAELNCVGLAIKTRRYLDVIPEAMLEEAERLDFPLIEIPVQYPLSKICKVVFERLSGGGVEKADRFVSLYHSITESMLEPEGITRMLAILGDFIGNSVLLLGSKWELLGYAENEENPLPMAQYLRLQPGEVVFPEDFTCQMPADFAKYTKAVKRIYAVGDQRVVCRIMPLSGGNALFGYLLVWETRRKMQSIEYLALEIAVSALALDRYRTRQMEEIRMHIRQDFFDDLLSGKLQSAEEVDSIAGMHNMEADGTYLCTVAKLDSAVRGTENYVEMHDAFLRIKDRMIAAIAELAHDEGRSCISIHRGSLIITFLRLTRTESDQRIGEDNRQFIRRMYHRLHAVTEQYVLNIGVGEPTARLINVRRSFTQAQEAIRVSGGLRSTDGVHFYEDLIIYQLLNSGVENEKSTELYTLSIRSLVEYDRQNETNMVETLDCYFACKCNVSETAKALYIHRNTLIYRIEKIKTILGRDLKNSEERLLLQLGLRIYQVQQIRENGGGAAGKYS